MRPPAAVLVLGGWSLFAFWGAKVPADVPAPPDPPAEVRAAVEANNAFALDLYRALAAGGDNLFFSPFSVTSALGLTAAGARGETATEMQTVLHFPREASAFRDAMGALNRALVEGGDADTTRRQLEELNSLQAEYEELHLAVLADERKIREEVPPRDELDAMRERQILWHAVADSLNRLLADLDPTDLEVANALWGERTYPFRTEYLEFVGGIYGAGALREADFLGDPEGERARINDWVGEVTHQRIRDLFPEGSITPLARLVLANAVYFKSEWESPFDPDLTREEKFFLADGGTIQSPLMKQLSLDVRYGAFRADGSFFPTPVVHDPDDTLTRRYPGEDGFAIVEIPYRTGRIVMGIAAPNRPDGLGALEARLDPATLAAWTAQLRSRTAHVYIPRFREETSYSLGETLAGMGMASAFDPDRADFSGMTSSSGGPCLSLVLHKAFVDVNEEGTEAAAATGPVMPYAMENQFTPEFRADRPFLFWIRDATTGCILFLGRVTNPTS